MRLCPGLGRRSGRMRGSFVIAVFMLLACGVAGAAPKEFLLPTENTYLFSGQPERFFMYVDRNFEGKTSQPWEGGAFGYVRSPRRVNGEVVMTRFHEGIDIAPIKRDKAGNPLDLILSVADGTVVYTSAIAGRSNYGKYVVVEHVWEGSKVYSLYAHLAEITARVGLPVRAGGVLGRMGYTGVGLNRTRAHVHVELALMMSPNYEGWHKTYFGSVNFHGMYNGMNLAGVNITEFYLQRQQTPELKFKDFVLSQPLQFKVAVPKGVTDPEFLQRYPWMRQGSLEDAHSWEIGFAATGHAVSFTPSRRVVGEPEVTHLRPSDMDQRWLTRGLVRGVGKEAVLSPGGRKMVALVMDDFPKEGGEAGQ